MIKDMAQRHHVFFVEGEISFLIFLLQINPLIDFSIMLLYFYFLIVFSAVLQEITWLKRFPSDFS